MPANFLSLRLQIEACQEVVLMAQLAEDHYNKYQRPLEIAVDESG
jgi:hypothetical protein